MPRYCLFGNHVLWQIIRIGKCFHAHQHKPTTYELLESTRTFLFTPRTRADLPKGFPKIFPESLTFWIATCTLKYLWINHLPITLLLL
ncbi:hypothetical protein TNCT_52401 [Trichonephila clavata]|uniref:Uncharacterized protein n=1 Tax=Trichonephila clavata TaxID=2740835 RepID=A0A8X6GF56_TRICU|nr:hypothetical protein TNCT_52401 [Trichonephila clavata]